jgi:hypothetical protein
MKLTPLKLPVHLAALLLALTALPHAAALATSTNRTFTVASSGHLIINADRGAITVATADTNTLSVTVDRSVKWASDEKAQELFAAHELNFTQTGNTVTVKARLPKSTALWNRTISNLDVKYTVTVPKKFDLTLSTAGGSIHVDDLAGQLKLDTAGGSIHVGQIEGSVKADTAGGSIHIASATGPVEADTAGGSIKLGRMGGPVKADTAGGSIRIAAAAGPVHADTSGGSIELSDVAGPVTADVSGGSITARFIAAPTGESVLDCTGGSVTVYLAQKLGFTLDAQSVGGRVACDLAVESDRKPSRTSLKGQINGGGAPLKLRAVGGGITVRSLAEKTP